MDDANKTEAGFTASNEGEQEGEDRKFVNLVLCTLIVATVLIVVRSVYRCIEMLNFQPNHPGAYGDQTLFLVLDSAFMLALLIVYALIHPGWILARTLGLSRPVV